MGGGVVSTETEAIGGDLAQVVAAISRAREETLGAAEHARHTTQHAAAQGYPGIAAGMDAIRSQILAILAALDSAATAARDAEATVRGVSDRRNPDEVAARLAASIRQIDAMRSALYGAAQQIATASGNIHQTLHGGQPGPLLERLDLVRQLAAIAAQRGDTAKQRLQSAISNAGHLGSPEPLTGATEPAPTGPPPSTPSSATAAAQYSARAAPQGLTAEQFVEAGRFLRAHTAHLGGELVVQGSRAAGTASPESDLDFGIRVEPAHFAGLIAERFRTPTPGSAKERTMQKAIETGKIQAGELGLSGVRRSLESQLGMEVDLSAIRRDGPFDNPPFIGVP